MSNLSGRQPFGGRVSAPPHQVLAALLLAALIVAFVVLAS